jgi:Tfp pilus assembly PilM family ATPase
VIVGLPAHCISTRLLDFPFADIRKLETAIAFELEGQIPYDLEDIQYCWSLIEQKKHSSRVLAAFTLKDELHRLLGELEAAHLPARSVVLTSACLAELVMGYPEQAHGILYIHNEESHFCIGRQKLRYARPLLWGYASFLRTVMQHLSIDEEEARNAFHQFNLKRLNSAKPEVIHAVKEALKPLLFALSAMLRGLDKADYPETLSIGGSYEHALLGLADYLSEQLGIEFVDLELSEIALAKKCQLDVTLNSDYTLPFAMAMASIRGKKESVLNFRRGAFAYQGDIIAYRGQIGQIAAALAIVLVINIVSFSIRFSLLRAQENAIKQGFCTTTRTLLGKEICDPQAALSIVNHSGASKDETLIPSYSAGNLLEMLSKRIDGSIDVQFNELDLRIEGIPGQSEHITGKGEADSFETTEQLVAALKLDACVSHAEVSRLHKAQSGSRVEFNLDIKIDCPVGILPGAMDNPAAQKTEKP